MTNTNSQRSLIAGRAVPVRGNDIDTDRIIPARFLKTVVFDGLGNHVFEDDRIELRNKGQQHAMDKADFQGAEILVVNKNFGCGSSREHAPQAIMRWGQHQKYTGIRAIIGESFAEIFFGNCVSLGIPCVTASEADVEAIMHAVETDASTRLKIDLEARLVMCGQNTYPIFLRDDVAIQMITGTWDSTHELLSHKAEIAQVASALPYVSVWGQ